MKIMKRNTKTPFKMRILLAASMILFFPIIVAQADTSLTVGNTPGYPGTTASVPVYLAQGSNVVISQFDVSFNPSKVSPAGAAMAPRVAGQRVKSRDIGPGLRRVLAYSLSSASIRSTNVTRAIATFPFMLASGQYVSSGPLTPTNSILIKGDESLLPAVTRNSGAIFAQPVFLQPDGSVDFFVHSMPGTNYWVQASSNLVQWTTLSTNRATSDFLESADSNGRFFDYQFYRALPVP